MAVILAVVGAVTCGLGARMALTARRAVRVAPADRRPRPTAGATTRSRAVRAATAQVPAFADTVLAGILAGQALPEAFDAAAAAAGEPLSAHLSATRRSIHLGTPLPVALRALTDDPVLTHLAAALTLTYETGGNAAMSLQSFAAALRDSAAVAQEARALSATARAQARLLAGLPLGVFVLSMLAEPTHAGMVLGSTAGRLAVGAGLLLDACGLLAIRRVAQPR